jgi:hypothetical protein
MKQLNEQRTSSPAKEEEKNHGTKKVTLPRTTATRILLGWKKIHPTCNIGLSYFGKILKRENVKWCLCIETKT